MNENVDISSSNESFGARVAAAALAVFLAISWTVPIIVLHVTRK